MRASHRLDRLDTAFDDDRLVADAGSSCRPTPTALDLTSRTGLRAACQSSSRRSLTARRCSHSSSPRSRPTTVCRPTSSLSSALS